MVPNYYTSADFLSLAVCFNFVFWNVNNFTWHHMGEMLTLKLQPIIVLILDILSVLPFTKLPFFFQNVITAIFQFLPLFAHSKCKSIGNLKCEKSTKRTIAEQNG